MNGLKEYLWNNEKMQNKIKIEMKDNDQNVKYESSDVLIMWLTMMRV